MAGKRIPIEPDITRKDLADAIAASDQRIRNLRDDLLDPERPSLLATLNEHREDVRKIVETFDGFIEKDYQPFKQATETFKARLIGWGSGVLALGAFIFAVIKLIK